MGQSQLVHMCLNTLQAQVWASSQMQLTCLWSAGLYLWEAAYQAGRGREKTFLWCPFFSMSTAGAAHHRAQPEEDGMGGITAGASSCPHLEPPNILFAYCMVKQTTVTCCWVCGIGWFMIHLAGNLSARCKARSCIMITLLGSSQKTPTGLGRIRPPLRSRDQIKKQRIVFSGASFWAIA